MDENGGFDLGSIFDRFTSTPTSTEDGVEGSVYKAIYALGAGKFESVRENLATAFLKTDTGSKFAAEVEWQRIMSMLPMLLLGGAVIIGLVFFMRR